MPDLVVEQEGFSAQAGPEQGRVAHCSLAGRHLQAGPPTSALVKTSNVGQMQQHLLPKLQAKKCSAAEVGTFSPLFPQVKLQQ